MLLLSFVEGDNKAESAHTRAALGANITKERAATAMVIRVSIVQSLYRATCDYRVNAVK